MKKLKQGVDYFPLNTDFIHDSVICRIMKRKGNSAFTILLYALSHIYSDKDITFIPTTNSTMNFLTSYLIQTTILFIAFSNWLQNTASSIRIYTNGIW